MLVELVCVCNGDYAKEFTKKENRKLTLSDCGFSRLCIFFTCRSDIESS